MFRHELSWDGVHEGALLVDYIAHYSYYHGVYGEGSEREDDNEG